MTEPAYLPVAEMYKQVTGYRPSPATIYRWINAGKIKTWLIKGRRMTTEQAVRDFIANTEGAPAKDKVKRSDAEQLAELDAVLASITRASIKKKKP